MKCLLLANPKAAGCRARRLLPRLREHLSSRIARLEYCESSDVAALRAAADSARGNFDRVLAAGGDGTVHLALNALVGSRTALGVLPLGHGNDLARALGIPLDPFAAADVLSRAEPSPMDVARVGERVYGAVAGAGLDAETNRRASSWGRWPRGHARYFLAGLATLAGYRPKFFDLVTDSEEFKGEAMWVAVANGPCYGGGIRIAPEARVDDGVLDVCVIEPMPAAAVLMLYPRIRRGEHLRHPRVRYFRARWVEFRAPARAEFFGDGELMGTLPLKICVEPAAAQVLRGRG